MYISALLIFLLCLTAASAEDISSRKVTDIIWWICGPVSLLVLPLSQNTPGCLDCFECLFAIFIQEHIMCRFYGRADSHAFSCCAVFLIFCGAGLEGHILHMFLSLILLSAHQMLRHNIGNRGKLISPVPFIPYISIAFAITVLTLNH